MALGLCATAEAQRTVLIPAEYTAIADGDPHVAPYLEQIQEATDRLWHDQVWGASELEGSLRAAWVSPSPDALVEVRQELDEAQDLISKRQFGKATTVLERLVGRADQLLPSVATSPEAAGQLLEAHLLLWRQYKRSKRHKSEHLNSLAATTARRFPSANLRKARWPAEVSGAFMAAVQDIEARGEGSLLVIVEEAPPGGCSIFVNGTQVGDLHKAGLPIVSGQAYYASVHCEGRRVSTRRVVPQGDHIVRLHIPLLGALRWTGAGGALVIPGGDDRPSRVAPIAAALGDRMSATEVVLAGITTVEGARVLQLDRINVKEGRRVCAVRLPMSRLDALPMAVQTLRIGTPVVGSPTLFVGSNGVWQTTDEYAEAVTPPGNYTWTWVAGGAALGMAGIGVLMSLQSDNLQDEVSGCELLRECAQSPKLPSLRSDRDSASAFATASYTAAGLLVVGSLVAFVLETPEPEEALAPAPMVELVPLVTPDTIGAGLLFNLD